ncbi:MAG: phosphatase PAP2 family protein [Calothrix sp. C42_A2020_038]|nr:phosphatase PAP2 family protein [Calothrix sp. C42_A2020_038]
MLSNITYNNSIITPVHTAVTGRTRYKVRGLYGNRTLKKYLESQLRYEKAIEQVQANAWTGNILVVYHPNFGQNAVAGLIQKIVLEYSKQNISYIPQELILPTQVINPQQQAEKIATSTLVPVVGTVSALAFSTLLVHAAGLDERILLTIQKLHSPLLNTVMLGTTLFGEGVFLLSVCGLYRSWLLHHHRHRDADTLIIAAIGGVGFNYILKEIFARARPLLWDRVVNVSHHSFPSGHAMISMIVYGYIGYTLAKQYPQHRNQISILTVALIMAIGFSRLYLGVHWLTDVTAGYAAGLLWLFVCICLNIKSTPAKSLIPANYSVPLLAGQFQEQ